MGRAGIGYGKYDDEDQSRSEWDNKNYSGNNKGDAGERN